YTPDPDFNGSDSYTYITGDEHGDTASAAVHVTVNPVNDTPVANNDVVNVDEDGTVLINVLSNDTDVDKDILSIIGFTQGRNGTVTKEGSSLRYTPDADFNGSDEFSYDISDGNGGIATGMVTVAINSINDAPVAVDDDVEVDEDGTVIVDVTANDTDVDGDVVVISSFTHGTNGSVAQDDGSLRYEPDAGYYGSDSFTYTVSDGNGGVSSATVYVDVNQKTLLSMDFDGVDSPTDYIEVNVPESGMHSFVTSYYRQSADTFMALYNGNKQLIAINDDYTSLYAEIHIDLTQGTYYVRIDEFDGGALYCHLEVKRQ
ncbi:MAG: Ig-like domain-containing protein, partial [Chitinispirillaceae bacterium]